MPWEDGLCRYWDLPPAVGAREVSRPEGGRTARSWGLHTGSRPAHPQLRPEPWMCRPCPQEQPAHPTAPARHPQSGAQPSAQPGPWQPRVPELRRAAAAGHGAVRAGAGGAAATGAPGGGGTGADPEALADRAVVPLSGLRPLHVSPTGVGFPGPCTGAAAGDQSHRLGGVGMHRAPDQEGVGMVTGYLSWPGQEAAGSAPSPCFAVTDPQPSPLSKGRARRS